MPATSRVELCGGIAMLVLGIIAVNVVVLLAVLAVNVVQFRRELNRDC